MNNGAQRKMSVKIIATDLDGTLLNSAKQIAPASERALAAAHEMGIKVVLTSSRPLSGIQPFLEQLGLAGSQEYAILYNGGLIQDLTGRILATEDLDYHDFQVFTKIWSENQIHVHFETLHNFLTMDRELSLQMARNSELTKMPILIKDYRDFKPDFRYLKAEFTGTADELSRFKEKLPTWFAERYSVVQSNAYTLAVTSKKASKGRAVVKLTKILGVDPKDVIIFGDQGNDLSMFKNPDFFKVAMKNGIEAVRTRADYVTVDNNHDGVAVALEKFVL